MIGNGATADRRMPCRRGRSALLKPCDLAFETGDFLLVAFHSVKSTFEATHPASQGLLLSLKPRAPGNELCLTRVVIGGLPGRPEESTAGRTHVTRPPAVAVAGSLERRTRS